MHTTTGIRKRSRTGVARGVELNIESPGDREDAAERIFPTSCDKKRRIASFPLNNKTRQGFPQHWERREGTLRERVATTQMRFYTLKLVTPQSHLLGRRKILHSLTVLKETPQDRGAIGGGGPPAMHPTLHAR